MKPLGKIFIDKVNKKIVKATWNAYKKVDFVAPYNPKFSDSKAEKKMVFEYVKVLARLITKKYKKVVVKHNDLNIMKYYHPSILSLDLRAFLKALSKFEFEKKYLMIKSGSVVPAFHNLNSLNFSAINKGLGFKILDGNRQKIQTYKIKNQEIPELFIPKVFDKDTLFVIYSDAKTNSYSGATIACKIAVVGTSDKRLRYHKSYDKNRNYTNIFGKYLTLYSQALERICGDVVSVINYKYKKEGTTCTFFESYPIEDPFILSGKGICAIDYAGELIMFGAPMSNMIKGYEEIFNKLPTLKMENAFDAKIELLKIHETLQYEFPKLNFEHFKKWYPGLHFKLGEECQDGCTGMVLFAINTTGMVGKPKLPQKCQFKTRIVTGKLKEPVKKGLGEYTVAVGDCAIAMTPKADLQFPGCPVSPFTSLFIPFFIPGFPSYNLKDFINSTRIQLAAIWTNNPVMMIPLMKDLMKTLIKLDKRVYWYLFGKLAKTAVEELF